MQEHEELVTALQGYLNLSPGGEAFTLQALLPAQKTAVAYAEISS